MLTLLLKAVSGLIVVIFILKSILNFINRIAPKRLPGLRGWPIIGNAIHIIKVKWPVEGVTPNAYTLQAMMGFSEIFKNELGFSLKLGHLQISLLTKARSVEQLFKSTSLSKPKMYKFLNPWLGEGLITSEAPTWRIHRKILMPAFSAKILDLFQPTIYEKSEIMVNLLKKHVDGPPIDVESPVSMCAMDIICETAMGYNIDAQKQTDSPFIVGKKFLAKVSFERMVNLHLMIDFVFQFTKTGRQFFKSRDVVHAFVQDLIDIRKAEFLSEKPTILDEDQKDLNNEKPLLRKPKAFLDLCLIRHLEDGSLSEADIKDEVNTFMFAGQDATSVAIVWCLFLLGHYPDCQTKLAKEVLEILGDDCNRPITTEELKHMKYMECVIKESLRLYPSVPLIARHVEDDIEIDGMLIKKGSVCAAFITALHQDAKVFPEPEKFKPERFTAEGSQGRHSFAFVPFSGGPRNCVGQTFAFLESKTLIANILRNFEIRSVDPIDTIPVSPEVSSRNTKPIRMKLTRRNFI